MPQGNGKIILVVDDSDAIRNITKSVLEKGGYRVLLASDGNEAFAIFAERSEEISLVLTDMVMPKMDGTSLVGAIREIRPDVKTIAVTAYIDSMQYVDLLGDVDAVVRKPYEIDMLLSTIDRLLTEPSGTERVT